MIFSNLSVILIIPVSDIIMDIVTPLPVMVLMWSHNIPYKFGYKIGFLPHKTRHLGSVGAFGPKLISCRL